MKGSEYILLETTLSNVIDSLKETEELCNLSEDIEFKKRFQNTVERLEVLYEEMIFTYNIEDDTESQENEVRKLIKETDSIIKKVGE